MLANSPGYISTTTWLFFRLFTNAAAMGGNDLLGRLPRSRHYARCQLIVLNLKSRDDLLLKQPQLRHGGCILTFPSSSASEQLCMRLLQRSGGHCARETWLLLIELFVHRTGLRAKGGSLGAAECLRRHGRFQYSLLLLVTRIARSLVSIHTAPLGIRGWRHVHKGWAHQVLANPATWGFAHGHVDQTQSLDPSCEFITIEPSGKP